jgi:hypothetical protein
MATNKHSRRRAGAWWRTVWPCWLLLIFAGLAVARALPAGPERAVIVAPILLFVPGALALGALLAGQWLRGAWFGCLAAVLSMIWAAFASLALYLLSVPITAESTYSCLLLICTLLAAVAQFRLTKIDAPAASAEDIRETNAWTRIGYPLAAIAGGGALLAGGTYTYLHVPHPAPVGYTWLAWSGKKVAGVVPVGGAGITMPFEIEHQQPDAAAFQLTAVWTGTGQQHALAKPVTFHIGPDNTMRGVLAIPPPPGGCTYRLLVTLTELGQPHPQSWSINADVRHQAQRQRACAS